jgi:LEA14-like dessication related protein
MESLLKLLASLIGLSALCISGCSTHGMIEPEVSLVNVRFSDVTLLSTEGVFTIQVDNDNNRDLKLGSAVHKIYLNGDYVGKGYAKDALYLPALSSSTQKVQVKFNNLALIGRVHSLIESEKLDYRIESRFYIDRGFGDSSITSIKEGSLDLGHVTRALPKPGSFRTH